MRALIILLLTAVPLRAGSWEQPSEPWSDYRYRDEEIHASKELRRIQRRIDKGDLPKVQFDFDSAEIRPDSFATLNLIADLLLKTPKIKLRITAHTCTLGSYEYNMRLSTRRARSVKEYLVMQGVPPPSIRYRGLGYTQPIADNSTEEGRIKNRRVEFTVVRRGWGSVY